VIFVPEALNSRPRLILIKPVQIGMLARCRTVLAATAVETPSVRRIVHVP
jgi:hypothetical protein